MIIQSGTLVTLATLDMTIDPSGPVSRSPSRPRLPLPIPGITSLLDLDLGQSSQEQGFQSQGRTSPPPVRHVRKQSAPTSRVPTSSQSSTGWTPQGDIVGEGRQSADKDVPQSGGSAMSHSLSPDYTTLTVYGMPIDKYEGLSEHDKLCVQDFYFKDRSRESAQALSNHLSVRSKSKSMVEIPPKTLPSTSGVTSMGTINQTLSGKGVVSFQPWLDVLPAHTHRPIANTGVSHIISAPPVFQPIFLQEPAIPPPAV